jgi:hypothetical protein
MTLKLLQRKNWPWLAIAATMVLMVLQLRVQGRVWFCDCREIRLWVSEHNSEHTSQHFADPYTFTHVLHGFIFLWVVQWLFPKWKWGWQLWLTLFIEAAWEVIENTQWVIDRYRNATAALGYTGDSVWNAFGDLLACWAGIEIAKRIGWRWTWIVFVLTEVVLIVTIRDSLLINVIQLLFPWEGLKQWQMAA